MKVIKCSALVIALSVVSFGTFARTVSATALTLDDAESQIAQQAKQAGDHYKIIESSSNNEVHMTARLFK
ncbi:MAG TPA: DUF1471 domain-containing protein [Leclercia adecarboxylata]|jgi:hypothetical protein|nr:DUF1471 domain-containing protein [Leclercia adecarboxylata]